MMRLCFKAGMSVSEFWESTYRDIYNYVTAYNDRRSEDVEQNWDFVRHVMWASLQPNSKDEIKVASIIRLKRDGVKELTPYERQELAEWSKKCDDQMISDGMILVDWDGNPIN